MPLFPRKALVLLIALLLPSSAFAAAQNKLIARNLRWKVAQTEHFDIYHYPGAESLLPFVSRELERSYAAITGALGISIPGRSAFFLFLNHNDFEQNNIANVGEGTGGVTEAFKNRFLIFNDGSRTWLEHVIAHEFVHVCQFNVLYSGFWKSVRLLKSVLYPLWFMEGMAEFYSGDIDEVQEHMVLRDAMTSGQWMPLQMLHGFNHVKPHQVTLAYKTGNAAMHYIAQEYGEEKIGLLLKDISEKFDVNGSLGDVLGISLADFDRKFQEEMEEKYKGEVEELNLQEPDRYGAPLTRPDQIYPVFNGSPEFFSDGKQLAYLSDKDGYTELFVYQLEHKRAKALHVQRRFPDEIENINRSGSALSVSPDGRWIAFAGERRQKDYLYLYDVRRDDLKRLDPGLDGAMSPQFSPDGERIAFIGMRNGLNDVYLCRLNGGDLRRLTETPEDERDVRFFPDGGALLFSRESAKRGERMYERDLVRLDLANGKESAVTSMAGNETHPAVSPDGREIAFIADESGVQDLYTVAAHPGARPARRTRVIGGNFNPTYSPDGKSIVFVSHRKSEQHLYQAPVESLDPLPSEIAKKAAKPAAPNDAAAAAPEEVDMKPGRPYRLKASTDFFFPIFYYSSQDGLFASAYWQASEMLGNHQVQASVTYASLFDFLNYQFIYSYLRFRPQLTVGFLGDTSESVFLATRESRREDAQFVQVEYPLSRFDSVQFQAFTTQRRIQFEDDDFVTFRFAGRENAARFGFTRDVSQGRYLETTSGYRVSAQYEDSNKFWDSSIDYRNVFLTLHQFVPVHRESVVAFRAFGGGSFGSDRQFFRTGGADMLRGFGRFDTDSAASNFAISNLELRFPIVLNANWHIWFFFPDFLFKNVYGAVFTDNGVLWNRRDDLLTQSLGDVKNSVGAGLRFQTFVLQTFPVILQFDWARRTKDGEQSFYLGLGPTF